MDVAQSDLCWKDVTSRMRTLQKKLRKGQMIHQENFNHERVMAAVELFDQKMDSSLPSSVVYIEDLITEGKVPTELPESACIGLLDDLLCCLANYINGVGLEDSVFRLIYFHAPARWPTSYLKTFSSALLKSCIFVKRCVRSTRVSEEDEFIFSRFYELMKDSIDEFQDVESTTTEELLASLMDLAQEHEGNVSLCARFHFLHAFLQCEFAFEKRSLDLVHKSLEDMQTFLKIIVSEESESQKEMFVAGLTRAMNASRSPRNRAEMSREDCWKQWHRHVEHCFHLCTITTCKTLRQLRDFCQCFSHIVPNITVRSHLVVLIGDMYGLENFCLSGKPLRRIVSDDFRFFCPWARPLMPALEDHYNDVMNFSVNAGQQLLRYHGKSMAFKLRIFKYLMDELSTVQHHLNAFEKHNNLQYLQENFQYIQIDAQYFKPFENPFTISIFEHHAVLMCEYIEMQIACKLLNPQEMRPAYYYYNYLCDFRHRCIATANKVYAPVTQVRKQLQNKKKKKKNKKLKIKKVEAPSLTENADYLWVWALKSVAGAIWKFTGVVEVRIDGWDEQVLNSQQKLNFMWRYEPLADIVQPRPLTWEDYVNVASQESDPLENLASAQEMLQQARSFCDVLIRERSEAFHPLKLDLVKKTMKLAVANTVAIVKTRKYLKSEHNFKITYNFEHHPYFPSFRADSIAES